MGRQVAQSGDGTNIHTTVYDVNHIFYPLDIENRDFYSYCGVKFCCFCDESLKTHCSCLLISLMVTLIFDEITFGSAYVPIDFLEC